MKEPVMADVIELSPASTNRQCPDCGGEWWLTDGITVGADGHATGYSMPLRCMVCTAGGELRAIT